jgi:hypothetical protein
MTKKSDKQKREASEAGAKDPNIATDSDNQPKRRPWQERWGGVTEFGGKGKKPVKRQAPPSSPGQAHFRVGTLPKKREPQPPSPEAIEFIVNLMRDPRA